MKELKLNYIYKDVNGEYFKCVENEFDKKLVLSNPSYPFYFVQNVLDKLEEIGPAEQHEHLIKKENYQFYEGETLKVEVNNDGELKVMNDVVPTSVSIELPEDNLAVNIEHPADELAKEVYKAGTEIDELTPLEEKLREALQNSRALFYGELEYYLDTYLKEFFSVEIKEVGFNDNHPLNNALFWFTVSWLDSMGFCEYGTSPRGAWLTTVGMQFKDYVLLTDKPITKLLHEVD